MGLVSLKSRFSVLRGVVFTLSISEFVCVMFDGARRRSPRRIDD